MITRKIFLKTQASDRGVALLFALGILSALMLLGIAFMGSSLFSRRIAENRSNGNEARLLARSVANLVAGAVMMYEKDIGNRDLPNDFRAVFSRVESNDTDVYHELLRGYPRISNTTDAGLSDYSRLDVGRRSLYHGGDSLAQWVYVHDKDDNIIGRYAYQVLPKQSLNRINFYWMLSGNALNQIKYTNKKKSEKSGAEAAEYNFKPQEARFGQEIDEIPFLNLLRQTDSETVTDITDDRKLPAYFSDLFAAQVLAGGRAPDDYLWRAWFESNFIEGTTPAFREIAPGDFRRFNLTEWLPAEGGDPWLVRFEKSQTDVNTNADEFLKTMTKPAELPADDNGYVGKVVYDNGKDAKDQDQTVAGRGGLPFFRVIGKDSEKGSFSAIADLRRQIAANFNDYCDADSIPTSDLANASWSPDTAPTYTGNEKTLYINEFGLGLFLKFVNRSSSSTISVDISNADLLAAAELIDIYGNLSPENYSFRSAIRNGSLQITVLPQLDITYNVTVKDSENNPKPGGSFPGLVASNYQPAVPKSQSVSWASADLQINSFTQHNSYFIGASNGVSAERNSDPNVGTLDFSAEIESRFLSDGADIFRSAHPDYSMDPGDRMEITITNMVLSGIKVTIDSFDVTPGNFVLNEGANSVDYTKTQAIHPANTFPIEDSYRAFSDSDNSLGLSFFVEGMEAKDPRQNLNVSCSVDGEQLRSAENALWQKSDWIWEPHLLNLTAGETLSAEIGGDSGARRSSWGGTPSVGSITSAASFATAITDNLSGACNTQASPSGNHSSDRDPEEISDPAWRSTTEHISTAVIRNAPMKSPWELGFIHRGIQFQTINLKRADNSPDANDIPNEEDTTTDDVWSSTAGTTYANGDGGILDWIKMTGCSHSYGKINLRQYLNNDDTSDYPAYQVRYDGTGIEINGTDWKNCDKDLLDALFHNIPNDSAADFVRNSQNDSYTRPDGVCPAVDIYTPLARLSQSNDIDRRSKYLNLFDWGSLDASAVTDADKERLIGRTFNLLTADSEPPPVFYAVIIAQAIKDVGGGTAVSSDHPGTVGSATIGSFDLTPASNAKDNVHYDVITGEAKILVTYERNPVTGQVIIRDIENIE